MSRRGLELEKVDGKGRRFAPAMEAKGVSLQSRFAALDGTEEEEGEQSVLALICTEERRNLGKGKGTLVMNIEKKNDQKKGVVIRTGALKPRLNKSNKNAQWKEVKNGMSDKTLMEIERRGDTCSAEGESKHNGPNGNGLKQGPNDKKKRIHVVVQGNTKEIGPSPMKQKDKDAGLEFQIENNAASFSLLNA